MAADALAAHQTDLAAGKDALLLADTTEMCDALNRRVHDHTIAQHAAAGRDTTTVTGARGHNITTGDVVITRRNDPTITVYNPTTAPKPWMRRRCVTATLAGHQSRRQRRASPPGRPPAQRRRVGRLQRRLPA